MKNAVLDFRKKYGVPEPNSTVLCACSGGADSITLLHLLSEIRDLHVFCAHFNHQLRGQESDRDERFVREFCELRNVKCITGTADVAAYAAEKQIGIEEAARELRYAFLENTAEKYGCSYIATAHNAEDNAETVLMNLIRGTGLKGLCGIPPVRERIIRPLLSVSRTEILEYLMENGLPHVEDSSNCSDEYTRNRIRHHVLPLLVGQNPSAIRNISASSELLRSDEEVLQSEAERYYHAWGQKREIPIQEFLRIPKPIGSRILRMLCGPVERIHIESIYALCRGDGVHAQLYLPGMRVSREYDQLYFDIPESKQIPETEICPNMDIILGTWHITCREETFSKEIYNSFNTFYFKSEIICGKIFIASRKEGAKIRLAGRNCTKTLKKLFAEAGLTLAERLETPVLYDENGVIAVYGFGIAEKYQAIPGDSVICVTISKRQEG